VSASILAVVATAWGIAMGLSPTLQIRRMLRTHSSRDVSLGYLVVLDVGFLLWLGYGISIANWALIASNTVALTVGTLTIAVVVHLRRPGVDRRHVGAGA
jgi:uncharacterized protein with PQ loop repeat